MRRLTRNFSVKMAVFFVSWIVVSTQSFACGWPNSNELGVHGGFLFYQGLIVQTDEQTGRTLSANQSVTVSGLAECAQICLQNAACSGVSHRPTSSGQCLTFAAYDFETGNNMSLYLHSQHGMKFKSAIIRQRYQGPICD